MVMDKLSSKWQSFVGLLEEGSEQVLESNLKIIHKSLLHVKKYKQNATCNSSIDRDDPAERIMSYDNFVQNIKKIKEFVQVLSVYKIDELIGFGGVGLAFSLLDPHENYVLKIQIIEVLRDRYLMTFGTSFNEKTFEKQQAGEYSKNEINFLESYPKIMVGYNGAAVQASIFVYSKLTDHGTIQTERGPKQLNVLKKEFFKFRSTHPIVICSEYYHYFKTSKNKYDHVKEKYMHDFKFATNSFLSEAEILSIFVLIEEQKLDEAFGYIFDNVIMRYYEFDHLTKEIYVKFSKNFFESLIASYERGIGNPDRHEGNYGFRRNSLDLIPFDI